MPLQLHVGNVIAPQEIVMRVKQGNQLKWKVDDNFLTLESVFFFNYLFWLCWVFIAAHGLFLVAASRGYC